MQGGTTSAKLAMSSILRMARSMRTHKQPSRLLANALLILGTILGGAAHSAPKTELHYAPNHNIGPNGQYLPGKVGFNLADVGDARGLDSLPNGVKGLVWIGQCNGVDAAFLRAVEPFVGNPKVFGFYLMDEPDPTGRYKSLCSPDHLKAESDWIHAHIAGAKTFIVLMGLSSSKAPTFVGTYNPTNSHIDLFGIDPYPCRTEFDGCDYEMIHRYVEAAESWGIPRTDMVPIYQAFGGGNWTDDGGGQFLLPAISQMQQILERWGSLVPTPVFDFAYSWGSQNASQSLENSPELQAVFARRNAASIGSSVHCKRKITCRDDRPASGWADSR
jgi:hypothetical protein